MRQKIYDIIMADDVKKSIEDNLEDLFFFIPELMDLVGIPAVKKDYSYDVYKIRTNKIISYSNLIATTSNVLYVAISAYLGNEKALKKLDIGGIIVTIHRLITDLKFRAEIEKEFLEKEFYKQVMGEVNLMEEYK